MSSVNQSISMAEDDPLIQALPPATDYLTYLTLLEYQLTPARLPILHRLLQDETLTTNIGWDLVKILLPMLPASLECLQDVARLGNPREVILRVADALMHLHPADDDDDQDEDEGKEIETQVADVELGADDNNTAAGGKPIPLHVLKFNTLVAMLSTLHTRIQTKSPSRFLATSLQAALEAYTSMPTNETTLALLEFMRDVSPTKRPPPPPRAPSDSAVLRVVEASAPDPEAEVSSPKPGVNEETLFTQRFLQFGLIELLKSYLLSCSGPMDPGMSWAIRLQEKFHPESRMPGTGSPTNVYRDTKQLGERDTIVAKITALSQDIGLTDTELLKVVLQSPETQPPPLDFEEHPKKVEDIPLERHGSLLLLAARGAVSQLFSSGKSSSVNVYPDLAQIFDNFVGKLCNLNEVAFEQPQVLLDSLLVLTILALQQPIHPPFDETEFTDFVISLTACTVRQTYTTVRRIPATIIHNNPSQIARFKLIRKVLEDDYYRTLKDRAIDWLKDEILAAAKDTTTTTTNIFLNPHYFSVLFPLLYTSPTLTLDLASGDLVTAWIRFTQTASPSIHAALNLFYIILSSPNLRKTLQIEKTYVYFRNRFLEPLKTILGSFTADLPENGGDGKIEASVGEDMVKIGMARSVKLVEHIVNQVEDAVREVFVLGDGELAEPSADDIARVDALRKETEV
ncbi:YAP-binding/ALF4/Glomulin [Aspergillus pseudoustus]|uniref:YAP-binding/ALF4/Glomulin n=1 Tax=Aspergillus pseudoustus TaxID=1810923 RepID=A0ABR4IFT2_9EURO